MGLLGAQKPVRWSFAARTDLLQALEYLVEESPRVREVIVSDLRQILVGRYRLIYRVEARAVGVVRLLHGARDFRRAWRKRSRS